ncbi:MAG: DNA polymerase III subunit gamma/tau, partial [Chitinophagales bacterium]|nr:DNA polymerase III subunit gamma/tau [Chitinophagales bacterium]
VEDIRSLVDQVRYAPASGKFKIYIIDEVHMLSASAFNAFLKTLEEPPLYVKFILATTEKHKIIPTILSRCQIFDFNRIRIKDMTQQLEIICKNESIDCTDEAMHLIAQKADGAMRDALSIFDRITSFSGKSITAKDVIENLNILDYEYFFKITDAFVVEDVAAALVLFDEVVNKGFDGDIFINGLAEHFRNILVCKDESTLKLLDTSETVIERYKSQSNLISASFLLSGLNILNSTDVNYRASKNKRLHVELALMKLCYVHSAVSTLSAGGMEKKTPDLNEKRPIANIKPISTAVKSTETNNISDIPTVSEEPVKKVRVENSTIITPQLESVETVVIPKKTDIRQAIKKEEDEKSAALLTKTVEEPLKVISPEMFFIVWKQYADFIRKDQNRVAIIMDAAAVSINETNNIVVRLESNLEANIMKEMQNDLREFIKDGLENNQFDISFIVESVKSDKIKRPYTTQEKYKKMEEINPLIKELKETLGFELDY